MKLTTKNLLIILAIVIGVFAITQFTKRGGKSKSLRSELIAMDTSKVSKIEVIGSAGLVTLQKQNNTWNVSIGNGMSKPAKKTSVDAVLTALGTIKPGRLAAKKEEKWKDYSVDSTGTRVKVFEETDLTTDIVLGRFGVEGQRKFYTFVRLFEEQNVYVANDFMKMSVYENANDYRDNTLARITKDSISSINFSYPDSAFSLVKADRWLINGQERTDSASVASYLSGLSFLTSKSFYDDDLNIAPTHEIAFSFTNQTDIVISGVLLPDGFVIKSSENAIEAFNDESLNNKVFKGLSAFQPTSD